MIELSDMERDAVAELFNISIARAASSLGEMLGQEVLLSIPEIIILLRSEAAEKIGGTKDLLINGVCQHFQGPFLGDALLLFPEKSSLELVRIMLKEHVSLSFLTDMEQEALVEVGNIILNACLGTLANIFEDEILTNIPELVKGSVNDVIIGGSGKKEDYVMLSRMDFVVREVDVAGYIAFLMDIQALDIFRQKLTSYFGHTGGLAQDDSTR